VLRSQIVLQLAGGHSQAAVARALGVSRETVARWEQRFAEAGADGLLRDRPGRGRPPGRNRTHVARVLEALRSAPPGSWTVRTLAAHVGISAASVQRIWRERTVAPPPELSGQFQDHAGRPRRDDAGKPLASADTGKSATSASA
jgi:transposase